ncbi:hypothetical protein TRVL_10051 [Trypanosoma vivax]|nr:hypothetical protein TRVL_10051 [Trypanosoma vivax]
MGRSKTRKISNAMEQKKKAESQANAKQQKPNQTKKKRLCVPPESFAPTLGSPHFKVSELLSRPAHRGHICFATYETRVQKLSTRGPSTCGGRSGPCPSARFSLPGNEIHPRHPTSGSLIKYRPSTHSNVYSAAYGSSAQLWKRRFQSATPTVFLLTLDITPT